MNKYLEKIAEWQDNNNPAPAIIGAAAGGYGGARFALGKGSEHIHERYSQFSQHMADRRGHASVANDMAEMKRINQYHLKGKKIVQQAMKRRVGTGAVAGALAGGALAHTLYKGYKAKQYLDENGVNY